MVVGVETKLIPVSMVVDLKATPLVIPAAIAPELLICRAPVTTVEPVPFVSALSKRSKAAKALSVVLVVTWFWICAAYSVLPATVGLLVKLTPSPTNPLVLADVPCA